MITNALILIFAGFFQIIINTLPTINIPSGISSAVQLAWGYLNAFSFLYPLGTLETVLIFAFIFYGVLYVFDITLYVLEFLRGK